VIPFEGSAYFSSLNPTFVNLRVRDESQPSPAKLTKVKRNLRETDHPRFAVGAMKCSARAPERRRPAARNLSSQVRLLPLTLSGGGIKGRCAADENGGT